MKSAFPSLAAGLSRPALRRVAVGSMAFGTMAWRFPAHPPRALRAFRVYPKPRVLLPRVDALRVPKPSSSRFLSTQASKAPPRAGRLALGVLSLGVVSVAAFLLLPFGGKAAPSRSIEEANHTLPLGVRLTLQSAEKGSADAQTAMFLHYLCIEKDKHEAMRWCRLAAGQGQKMAQHYLEGLETPEDHRTDMQRLLAGFERDCKD